MPETAALNSDNIAAVRPDIPTPEKFKRIAGKVFDPDSKIMKAIIGDSYDAICLMPREVSDGERRFGSQQFLEARSKGLIGEYTQAARRQKYIRYLNSWLQNHKAEVVGFDFE